MREKIIDLMNNKGDLPPLPDVLIKLQQIIDDPRTGIPDIVKILEMDPVLAAKIMSVSNSVHYTRGAGASKTLLMAVNKIGRNELLKIVYSIELSKMFSDNRIMDYTDFWKHCLSVAVMTQSLCKRLNFEEDYLDIAYLTGLLHDVGIMVFAYLVPDEYKNFLSATQGDDEESFERQEINTFGIDHSELGGMFISKWWDLDDRISQAIKYHHFPYPEEKMLSEYVKVINVANGIVTSYGISNGVEGVTDIFHEGAWDDLGLSLEEVDEFLEEAKRSVEQASEFINS